jgi:hypothetical protein
MAKSKSTGKKADGINIKLLASAYGFFFHFYIHDARTKFRAKPLLNASSVFF